MLSKHAFGKKYDVKSGLTELEFQYKLKFGNTLPDLPYDPKFIPVETLQLNRFVHYNNTQLEQNMKMKLDFGLDLGVHTELTDIEKYNVDPKNPPKMHPSDAFLLDDESTASVQEKKRTNVHRKPVPFMRKSAATMSYRRMGVGKERTETKIGYGLAKKGEIPDEGLYRTKAVQIAAIEQTFEDVKTPIKKHYRKKGVYAVEEFPILPDFSNFQFTMTQVTFDKNPVPALTEGLRKLALENSFICDMHGILGHFTPTEKTLQRILEENDGEKEFDRAIPLEYVLDRDYSGTQQPVRENFYLAKDGNEIKFGPLNSYSVTLSRVRRSGKEKMRPCKLEITRRDVSEEEFRERRQRLQSLVVGTNNDSDSDQDMDQDDHKMSTQEKDDSDYDSSDKELTPPPPVVKEETVRQETESSDSDDKEITTTPPVVKEEVVRQESETSESDDSDESSSSSSSLSSSDDSDDYEESPPATPGRFNAGSESDVANKSASVSADDKVVKQELPDYD